MAEVETISRALGGVATARDRLERETADLTGRVARELRALDDAIAGVRAERERIARAAEDERTRLERLAASVGRADGDLDARARAAERTRRRIAGQERLVLALAQDLARAKAGVDEAVAERERVARRARGQRRALADQLEEARREVARLSARSASAGAALAAAGPPPDVSAALADIEIKRRVVEAELAGARAARDAIPPELVDPAALTLTERIRVARQQERHRLEGEIARLAADERRLALEESALHRRLEDHAARIDALRTDAATARARLGGGHLRFSSAERAIEDEADRSARALAEAEAEAARGAALVRELELARAAEEGRVRELGLELEALERDARETRERQAAQRRELEEEAELRGLMTDLAAIDLALGSALAERETLERILGRVRTAAAIS